MATKCKFDLAWQGPCNKPTVEGSDYCEEHKGVECVSCGAQATHQCGETMGLVCGYDLCDDCTHSTQSNGCNSGGELPEGVKYHDKKVNQVYKPWYMRKNEEDLYYSEEEKKAMFPEVYDISAKEVQALVDKLLGEQKDD